MVPLTKLKKKSTNITIKIFCTAREVTPYWMGEKIQIPQTKELEKIKNTDVFVLSGLNLRTIWSLTKLQRKGFTSKKGNITKNSTTNEKCNEETENWEEII